MSLFDTVEDMVEKPFDVLHYAAKEGKWECVRLAMLQNEETNNPRRVSCNALSSIHLYVLLVQDTSEHFTTITLRHAYIQRDVRRVLKDASRRIWRCVQEGFAGVF
jgi:hypothetical protein